MDHVPDPKVADPVPEDTVKTASSQDQAPQNQKVSSSSSSGIFQLASEQWHVALLLLVVSVYYLFKNKSKNVSSLSEDSTARSMNRNEDLLRARERQQLALEAAAKEKKKKELDRKVEKETKQKIEQPKKKKKPATSMRRDGYNPLQPLPETRYRPQRRSARRGG